MDFFCGVYSQKPKQGQTENAWSGSIKAVCKTPRRAFGEHILYEVKYNVLYFTYSR